EGDPASSLESDTEAEELWGQATDLPPERIVRLPARDNFWEMGETGPCGPCSEIHIDRTPDKSGGKLVNKGDARVMEIWNLVFIQYNRDDAAKLTPLPARHVDTGMGFERVTSIIQNTKGFKDFNRLVSNYETDIFRPIFDALERMSGKKYRSTLPQFPGSATVPVASVGVPPTESGATPEPRVSAQSTPHASEAVARDAQQSDRDGRAPQREIGGATYYKRRLPHFERPWAKYMVSFSTRERRELSEKARDIVLKSLLFGHEQRRYQMYAACVLPDHVHFLFEPQVKGQDKEDKPIFWSLTELLHSIKSFTAHEINKLEKQTGQLWENESFDRMIRGDADLEEKFHYICRNPWDSGVVPTTEEYRWLWTPDTPPSSPGSATVPVASVGVSPTDSARTSPPQGTSPVPESVARDAQQSDRDGRAPQTAEQIQVDMAFRVIADHIRTLSFAIADGIRPGNTDRNYVLRRILRRAVRYGRSLGFHEPFLYKLVDILAETMGNVFPEIIAQEQSVQEIIRIEEEAFGRTLEKGLAIFEQRLKVQPDLDEIVRSLHDSSLIPLTQADLKKLPDAYEAARPILKRISDRFQKHLIATKTSTGAFVEMLSIAGEAITLQDLLILQQGNKLRQTAKKLADGEGSFEEYHAFIKDADKSLLEFEKALIEARLSAKPGFIPGAFAFMLFDTYGFPVDLTELMARERGLAVDVDGFERLMAEQRARARRAQKKQVIEVSQIETTASTRFVGYEQLSSKGKVLDVVGISDKTAVLLDTTSAYAEAGGQVGDTGQLAQSGRLWRVVNTQKIANTWLHFIEEGNVSPTAESAARDAQRSDRDGRAPQSDLVLPVPGLEVELTVDRDRRYAVQRHHTVTHLLHWALHEVVSHDAAQKGSYVGPEKLTFDFNSATLTPAQIKDIEKLVNERIVEGEAVSWVNVPYAQIKGRKDVMQFFGEKYGNEVRVVQIGGKPGELNGYSMELCGGTHTNNTGQIGLFRIIAESAIAAGVRRIEAVAGLRAYDKARHDAELLASLAGKINSPAGELEKKIDALLAQQKDMEKQLKSLQQKQAAEIARSLIPKAQILGSVRAIIENLGPADGDYLQAVADALKGEFKGVVVLGGSDGAVSLVATVSSDLTAKIQAGKIIQAIAPIVGGKGGGRPDNARGGGRDAGKLNEALTKASEILKSLG
ncbi:MAG: alanine--tRNA ligase-related protein, partial [Gemmataceae bacterium]|nr:alanine--tRNA ligase-related protein [Gemmataceae bacterium]